MATPNHTALLALAADVSTRASELHNLLLATREDSLPADVVGQVRDGLEGMQLELEDLEDALADAGPALAGDLPGALARG